MYLETEFGVPTVAVHADAFARLVDSVLRVNGSPERAPRVRADAGDGEDSGRAARLRRGRRPDPWTSVHGGAARVADPPAGRRRPARRRLRPIDAEAARARHGGEPAPAVPRQPLDGFPPDRASDRGARRGDVGRHESRPRRGRGQAAADELSRALGVHGREGRGQRGHGGRGPVVPPGHSRARLERADGPQQQHLVDCGDGRRSTARSATRSG